MAISMERSIVSGAVQYPNQAVGQLVLKNRNIKKRGLREFGEFSREEAICASSLAGSASFSMSLMQRPN